MKRDVKLDLLKALSIFGVVYIHSSYLFSLPKLPVSIFRFAVPVFIIVSFYLSEKARSQKAFRREALVKRLTRLLVPFVFWSVVYLLIDLKSFTSIYYALAINVYGAGWTGQYYFNVLIQLTIIYFLICRVQITPTLLITAFLLTGILYLRTTYFAGFSGNIHEPFYYWTFYVLFAVYSVQHTPLRHSFLIAMLGFAFLIFEDFILRKLRVDADPYARVSVLIAAVGLFTYFNSLNENVIKKIPAFVLKQIDLISKHTLGIFCVNPLICDLMSFVLPGAVKQSTNPLGFLGPYLTALIIVYICIGVGRLFKLVGLERLVK